MQLFTNIEYTLFVLAFLASLYMAIQEDFAKQNIILLLIMLSVLAVNSLFTFSALDSIVSGEVRFVLTKMQILLGVALYLLMYLFLLKKRKFRLILAWYFLFYLSFIFLIGSKFHPIDKMVYPAYSYLFGSVGVMIGIMLFFYEKLKEANPENIFRNFWFWISAGLFISTATEIPLMSLLNHFLQQDDSVTEQVVLIYEVKQVISLFYYLTYLIGVLCWKRI